MQIKMTDSMESVSELKRQYIRQATAPLDGMWLCGMVAMARHFGIYDDDQLIGYLCVNDEGYLLQFFVQRDYVEQSGQLFGAILCGDESSAGKIDGAFVSTAEPHYLSLCLDGFSRFEVNALMYQYVDGARQQAQQNVVPLAPIDSTQLSLVVDFAVANIGAPAEWLNGYFANLIDRQELFGVFRSGRLIATGESRGYVDYQTEYADVGMIVAKSERGHGVATRVLRQLVAMNVDNGLKSICSTEKANIAAQKAIGRAGFVSINRIVQFHG